MLLYVHIIFGSVVGILFFIFNFLDPIETILFILGNVAPDIDHVISLFVFHDELYNTARQLFVQFKLKEYARLFIDHHKEFNRLLIHNYIAFSIVFMLYLILIVLKNTLLSIFLLGFITHCVMDQIDDIKVVHHLHNWFWFIRCKSSLKWVLIVSVFLLIISYLFFLKFVALI